MQNIIIAVLVILNIFGFVLVSLDKYKAKNKLWRIPERSFFLLSILGGSIGVYIGLFFFNHKTRNWYFMTVIPFILLAQLIFIYYLINK
ncbi:MAG: putative rane protein [Eubacterium sp.]|nr:putative rane protein [Eubacterium sp.]